MPGQMLPPILLYGPTASGKSALALRLAERLGGAVINADSQQVYREWRVLSARPTEAEAARVPHMLYGHVTVAAEYSAGHWLGEVRESVAAAAARGLRPILVGGTGLYFRALTQGLAPVPPVPAEVRSRAEAALRHHGPARFAAMLAERDPETASTVDPANPARLLRAWEVLDATGRPLARWRAETSPPLLPSGSAHAFVLVPPREWLAERIARRLRAMVAEGVLDEVAAVAALGLPWSRPGLKALGAPDLARYLVGELTLEQALASAETATRRYAKRQLTWARGQMPDWSRLDAQNAADAAREIESAL